MNRKRTINYYHQMISDPQIEVVSFDVFGTLLLMPFWDTSDLFLFLDREISTLLQVPDIIDFSTYRKEAESFVKEDLRNIGYEDATIEEIYRYISDHYPIPQSIVQKLMISEVDLITRFSFPRNTGIELLHYAHSIGKRIIITSDIHLSEDTVKCILQQNNVHSYEKVYVFGKLQKNFILYI